MKEPRINLLRYQQEAAREKRAGIQFLIVTGIVILLCITAMGGVGWTQKQKLQAIKADNTALQQEVEELTGLVVSLEANPGTGIDINNKKSIIHVLENQVKVQSDNIKDLYLLSIPEITIGKMDIKSDNKLALTAYCNGQTKFINFLDEVRSLDCVKEVSDLSSRYNDKTGEVSFNLTLEWGEVK